MQHDAAATDGKAGIDQRSRRINVAVVNRELGGARNIQRRARGMGEQQSFATARRIAHGVERPVIVGVGYETHGRAVIRRRCIAGRVNREPLDAVRVADVRVDDAALRLRVELAHDTGHVIADATIAADLARQVALKSAPLAIDIARAGEHGSIALDAGLAANGGWLSGHVK